MNNLLVLGGTAEALKLAQNLSQEPAINVIYSLAGRTRSPTLPDCGLRVGGFGGVDGLVSYVGDSQIRAIVDATHPFAAQMAANARDAATKADVPLFKILRPAWDEPLDAPWLRAASPAEAADIIQGQFSRVFLSSGLGDLATFADLKETWFLVRSIDPSDAPSVLAQHHHFISRGPFGLMAEKALLRDWRIDALVSKNSGGDATAAKLEAARLLGVPIIMIARPPVLSGLVYPDVASTIAAVKDNFGR